MKIQKRLIYIILILSVLFSLTACGETGRYKTIKTLQKTNYYMCFRSDDSLSYYVDCAIKELSYEGKISELSIKWFGENICSFSSESDALKDVGYISERTLIVGVDSNNFPLCEQSGDTFIGFNIDLINAICDKLGWTPQFISVEPENTYIELSSGNVDIAMNADTGSTSEKDNYLKYGPYIESEEVLACLSTSSNRLKNKKLIMNSSEYYMNILESNESMKNKFSKITRSPDNIKTFFDKILIGEYDVVLCDRIAVKYFNSH